MGQGIADTLRRMKHAVTSCELFPVQDPSPEYLAGIQARWPSIEDLDKQDLILVSGPEHFYPWLQAIYTKEAWEKLTVPKFGWYHESFYRDDYKIDPHSLAPWCDEHFVPAAQDADYLDQEVFFPGRAHWLPFGVDLKMFRPHQVMPEVPGDSGVRRYPAGFIGLIYPKRQAYLHALSRHKIPDIRHGSCLVQDLDGYDGPASTDLLVKNYWRIRVFLNLPSMSELIVSKVYEVLACGGFLMTPMLGSNRGADKNMEQFKDKEHLIYYRPAAVPQVAAELRHWVSPEMDQERKRIAVSGMAHVVANYSLQARLEEMLKCFHGRHPENLHNLQSAETIGSLQP